jgi:dUTPase
VVVPRSSISNKQLILANFPIIDPDYTGQILLRYRFLPNPCDMVVFPDSGITRIYYRMPPEALFQKGEKLAQLILINYNDFQWETVTNLKATKRGSGGFGSTTEISETFPAKTP